MHTVTRRVSLASRLLLTCWFVINGRADWHTGMELQRLSIKRSSPAFRIGVKKIKRSDVVVVRVAHFHQPGQQERLELQLTGCELIAHHTKSRAGELNEWPPVAGSLRHAQAAPERLSFSSFGLCGRSQSTWSDWCARAFSLVGLYYRLHG